jgi:tRNA-Thr(GGU) m(6)t(6)A37 methyltransferase TsaA
MEILPIAHIHNGFREKFGIPRQSGITPSLVSRIVFTPKYRLSEALRGIEDFSYLWLIWEFSEAKCERFFPTVRPPRLGGNKKMGVFATRSPFRPNSLGLSSVRLLGVEKTKNEGTVLLVGGADILDGTPIYDVKPYLPYTDAHPDARFGFASELMDKELKVDFPCGLLSRFDKALHGDLVKILENDPRPSYQNDPNREYVMSFYGQEIHFFVKENTLHVSGVTEEK